jgi:hypothetical protein
VRALFWLLRESREKRIGESVTMKQPEATGGFKMLLC